MDAYYLIVPLYLRDTISFTRFVFSSWRHVPIILYMLVWFACSSCRCIVIMLDAHVDLCVLLWLIGVLTICFCFASSLAGFYFLQLASLSLRIIIRLVLIPFHFISLALYRFLASSYNMRSRISACIWPSPRKRLCFCWCVYSCALRQGVTV